MTKKICAICGGKLGMIIKYKLADGNYMCLDCLDKLPEALVGQNKHCTVEQMKDIMAYLEEHPQPTVENTGFHVTYSMGEFCVDEDKMLFSLGKTARKLKPETRVYSFSLIDKYMVEFRKSYVGSGDHVKGISYMTIDYYPRKDFPPTPHKVICLPKQELITLDLDAYADSDYTITATKIKYTIPGSLRGFIKHMEEWCGLSPTQIKCG